MSRIRRILMASDFSRASQPAFVKAVELARALKADLIVSHAVAPIVPVNGAMYVGAVDWDAVEKETRVAAQIELERLATAARKRRIRVATVLTRGYAADEIVRTARTRKASLVVMGTHGRTGLSRLVMGSVATRVIAGAPCPVMTVRSR
jgi:nucleotide-binding universal stress UspA family protein